MGQAPLHRANRGGHRLAVDLALQQSWQAVSNNATDFHAANTLLCARQWNEVWIEWARCQPFYLDPSQIHPPATMAWAPDLAQLTPQLWQPLTLVSNQLQPCCLLVIEPVLQLTQKKHIPTAAALHHDTSRARLYFESQPHRPNSKLTVADDPTTSQALL
jgi:hypothetical protein